MEDKAMQECIDKMAIKEVFARYAIAVDTGDADGFGNLFTEDARWEAFGKRFAGRKAIRDLAAAIGRDFPNCQHVTSNHVIEVWGAPGE